MIIIKIIIFLVLFFVFSINVYVIIKSHKQIIKNEEIKLENIDCLLVLGAGIINNERPTLMLKDRLDKSIELYKKGIAKKIIMSGDHGKKNHDEVGIMKNYAIERGVPSEDIFMDHAGFCTYDSIYRAKEIFGVKRTVIVTQKYHLYRSIFIANKLGIESFGIKSDARVYAKMPFHLIREILARCKNFFKCILKAKPKFLGEKISLDQSGDITND